ncbi:TerC family protein [Parapedobacter sp. ISTM3]|uniref:Membrane protein TerC, possibly involved in tellurium resistance n=1 Tax=Parapedobacter luteus TaxID=623280 RepID=A0A1T5AV42_9SPHI|nr:MULTISPECIES: TerC family protein [Parapedobacter]MBK1440269.1 TerC family protein [Parapedobacter sp. ISTM3]SKB38911.1 Membrane protein TerC, possibly involved in tellurium resistance [Parapedobacter luteus]
MEWLLNPEVWISLLTLTVLEIVLGIDNIVFISILSGKLPGEQQQKARQLGLFLALIMRVGLLFSIKWIMSLTEPFLTIGEWLGIQNGNINHYLNLSGRDLILLLGGLFLIYKATSEIHTKLEGEEHRHELKGKPVTFGNVIAQIVVLDIVFSLDSVITAVGMVDRIEVMIAAVIIAVGVMMLSAASISRFVNQHPTVKMLALAFLLLIGVSLTAEAFEQHIPKGYIYFAMAFSVLVEFLNLRAQKKNTKPAAPGEIKVN